VASLRDIATACGVAISTVSLALRDDPRVTPATTAKIRAVAAQLGYDPLLNDAARRLLSRQKADVPVNNIIGLIFPRGYHQVNYFNTLASGIMDVLDSAGFALLTIRIPASTADTSRRDIPLIFRRGEVDGLLLFAEDGTEQFIAALRNTPGFGNRPVVNLIHPHADESSVYTDDALGAYQSTCHLIALGHRHIAHTMQQEYATTQEIAENISRRLRGVRRAMEEHNLNPEIYLHYLIMDYQWMIPQYLPSQNGTGMTLPVENRTSEHPFIQQLHKYPDLTAILAHNDAVAIQIWYLLHAVGIRVPQEISLIGFDDTDPMMNLMGANVLSSVSVPLYQVGQEAAILLLQQITEQHTTKAQCCLPTSFINRSSTARNMRVLHNLAK